MILWTYPYLAGLGAEKREAEWADFRGLRQSFHQAAAVRTWPHALLSFSGEL